MIAGLYGLLLALILVMRLAPDSPAGRALNRQMVEEPMRHLAAFERHHLLMAVILIGMMIGGGELALVMGPEFVTAYALDLAIYFDAIMVGYVLAAAARAKSAWRAIPPRWPRRARARRLAHRRRRSRVAAARRKSPANDDEPAPVRRAA